MSNDSSSDLADILRSAGPSRRKRLGIILTALVVVVSAILWFTLSHRAEAKDAAPAFVTEALSRGDLSLSITATGNLEPTNEVTVGSELSGTVLEVHVDTNDRVTRGQPLALLDTSRLEQQTESSRASLRSAEANRTLARATVTEAEADLARLEDLRERSGGKLPSRAEIDAAVAAAERARASQLVAEAAVGQAQAQVKVYESDLGKAIIRSPIDGIVLTRQVEPGQTVAASFTAPELFVIAEKLENMKLIVSVAEADIGRLSRGQEASFTVDAWPDRSYHATVRKVSYGSAVTNNVVTYETELEVGNDDLSLRPGMTATAEIQVARSEDVFIVPAAALRFTPPSETPAAAPERRSFVQSLTPMPRRRPPMGAPGGEAAGPGRARVWVLQDGEPRPIAVRTGIADGRMVEIISDELSEGLPVIIRAR